MDELSILRARCDDLERSQRRLRLLFLVGLVLAGALLLMGQAPSPRLKSVEGGAFVLLDETGHGRAQLTLSQDGATALVMKNPDGVTDATLAMLRDNTLTFRLRSPRKTASIEITPDGMGALRITEKYAKSSVELGLDSVGRPRLILTDPEGKVVFKAPN